jgi:glycerol-3-phosphate acyltransferase PlsX
MRIILDGMGGDNAPREIVKGAAIASKLVDHEICIIGDEEQVKKELSEHDYDPEKISIVHSTEIVTGEDKPVSAIRRKKDSSLVKGLMMIKRGEGDMLMSAGNSGAMMTGAVLLLGRIGKVDRPALGAVYPFLKKGTVGLIVDAGANTECRPGSMLYFAAMGSLYAEMVLGIPNPTVGLINMGIESNKGTKTLIEAHRLLELAKEHKGLNFVGNIEGRDIPMGVVDVIICDGFAGNLLLKVTEGVALSIMGLMKHHFTSGLRAKIGALILKPKLNAMKKSFNYQEYGGAPILGVNAPIIKIHGSSTYESVVNGIIKAVPYIEKDVISKIGGAIAGMDEILALSPDMVSDGEI